MKSTILLFLLTSLSLLAQKSFVAGTVFLENGEKLTCKIDNKDWKKSPKFIEIELNGQTKKYQAAEILGFEIENGDIFKKVNFKISSIRRNSPLETFDNLAEYAIAKNNPIKVTALVRVVSKGETTLYAYETDKNVPHFLIEKEGDLTVLEYNKFMINDKELTEDKYFRNQLFNILGANPKLNDYRFEYLNYNEADLRKLFVLLNGASSVLTQSRGSEFGILAGASTSMATYGSLPILNRKNYVSPQYGIYYALIFKRNKAKLAIQNELFSSHIKNTFYETDYNGRNFEYNFSVPGLSFSNLLRFKIKTGNQSIYVLSGINSTFSLKNSTTYKVTNFGSGDESKWLEQIRPRESALIGGIGSTFNKIGIEARFQGGNGFSPYILKKSTTTVLALQFKYKLL